MISSDERPACCGPDEAAILAHKAGHALREAVDTASGSALGISENIMNDVRRHPLRTSTAAAGLGFLLGLLLRRR